MSSITPPKKTKCTNFVLENRIIGQDALARLAAAHGRFAAARRDGRRVILRNCSLIDLNLQCMNFAQAHFIGCNFTRADLTDANFSGALLFGSRFDEANLTRVNFENADLRAVIFDNAIIDETRFDHADLRKGQLIGAWSSVDVECFKESCSSFRSANLTQANLMHATLRDVDFSGANLDCTKLGGADLRGARFAGAELNLHYPDDLVI